MNVITQVPAAEEIEYPQSDGKPMADNTRQFLWIYVLFGNLAALFDAVADVFVCGNQFWYPVEGHPEINAAPDVYVVFGRPKGHRPSWKQWQEDDVPMTVVFEVLLPSNDYREMIDKLLWYEQYGVEEYYVFDPDENTLEVWLRSGTLLRRHRQSDGFVSPRLKIRFDLSGDEMVVRYPNGQHFLSFEEQKAENLRQQQRADLAQQRADLAQQRADLAQQRADDFQVRLVRLTELSRKARRGEAGPEELAELDRLENESLS